VKNATIVTIYDRTEAQYELSVQTVNSAILQDTYADLFILDNGSTCEKTKDWLKDFQSVSNRVLSFDENGSPTSRANYYLGLLFGQGYDNILALPNDVLAPPNLYRKLLEWPQGIVCPGMHGTNPPAIIESGIIRIHGDCHMSVSMIRKSAYDVLMEKDGYFLDEGMFMYASDCDLKVRVCDYGIPTAQLDILCWHYGGASHRLVIDNKDIYAQADRDRDYFTKKWGFAIGSEEYSQRLASLYSQDQVNAKS